MPASDAGDRRFESSHADHFCLARLMVGPLFYTQKMAVRFRRGRRQPGRGARDYRGWNALHSIRRPGASRHCAHCRILDRTHHRSRTGAAASYTTPWGTITLSTNPLILLAPRAGLEPATKRLTAVAEAGAWAVPDLYWAIAALSPSQIFSGYLLILCALRRVFLGKPHFQEDRR